jgi:hypothetical protein
MSNKKSVEINEKCSQIHIVVVHDDKPLSCTQLIIDCWWFYIFLVYKGYTALFRINTFMLTRWKITCCRFLESKNVSALDTKYFCSRSLHASTVLYLQQFSFHCYSGRSCFVLERFQVCSVRVAILTEILCNLSSTVLALNLEIGHEFFISSWHCHHRVYQHEYWVLNCRCKQKTL